MPAHLFVIHFPVALLLSAAVLDLLGAIAERPELRRWAGVLLVTGGVAAVVAFLTGDPALSAVRRDLPPRGLQAAETHSDWGGIGVWLLAGAAALRGVWRQRLSGAAGWANLAIALAAAALAVVISVTGTAIAHGG